MRKIPDSEVFPEILEKNVKMFRENVSNFNWEYVFHEMDAEVAHNVFINEFVGLYRDCFPYKTLRQSKCIRKSGVTPEILIKVKLPEVTGS